MESVDTMTSSCEGGTSSAKMGVCINEQSKKARQTDSRRLGRQVFCLPAIAFCMFVLSLEFQKKTFLPGKHKKV